MTLPGASRRGWGFIGVATGPSDDDTGTPYPNGVEFSECP